jgi:hypothetical protein
LAETTTKWAPPREDGGVRKLFGYEHIPQYHAHQSAA